MSRRPPRSQSSGNNTANSAQTTPSSSTAGLPLTEQPRPAIRPPRSPLPPSPSLTPSDSVSQLHSDSVSMEAYDDLQDENVLLRKELEQTKNKLTESQIKFVGAAKLRNSKQKPATNEEAAEATRLDALDKEIRKEANHFQVFFSTFLNANDFQVDAIFQYDDPIRYSSINLKKPSLGRAAELYESIPERFREIMALSGSSAQANKNYFVRQFLHFHSSGRSNAISKSLRPNCREIFDFDYSTNPSDREKSAHIRELLGVTDDGKYARFPPILFANNNSNDPTGRFQNEYLFKMAKVVLFGAGILRGGKAVARTPSAYLHDDVLACATPGLIAWCALIVRFLLSKDKIFDGSGMGAESGINYLSDYDFYVRYIISAREINEGWHTALMKKWNTEVFLQHNIAKRFIQADTEEVINIDDNEDEEDEMQREMRLLSLQEGPRAPTHAQDDAFSAAPIDDDELDSMYGDEAPDNAELLRVPSPAPPVPIPAPRVPTPPPRVPVPATVSSEITPISNNPGPQRGHGRNLRTRK
ncbi:hypothetical protein BDN70DRAFT_993004 [Pholiota conissans]|uniref:Uncharacterized protein n=1 Tax=Pholiota conissans TaxID=109636 RepID=A0A9P5Z2R5_9AGAR|nr:hypothetical protein BDN70DRAFT_993004 [Pholiota conissans]